jgi:hypothetical protein
VDNDLHVVHDAQVRRPGYACLGLGVLTVLATPVAVYWAVGDQSSAPPDNADYVMRPPQWSTTSVRTAGLVALCAMIAPTLLLVFAVRRRLLRQEWLVVVGQLAGVGAAVAVGYRVATAGVIGANIGWGLCVLFGVPSCIGLTIWAALVSKRLLVQQS